METRLTGGSMLCTSGYRVHDRLNIEGVRMRFREGKVSPRIDSLGKEKHKVHDHDGGAVKRLGLPWLEVRQADFRDL